MWWIVDHANLVYLLFVLAGIGLGLWFWQTRRVKPLVCLAGLAVLAVLFWLLCRFVVSDRRQLELNIHEMAQATLAHDAAGLGRHLAPDFQFRGVQRKEIPDRVVKAAQLGGVTGFHIWDFTIDELSREKRQAKVTFRLRIDARSDRTGMLLCRGTFTFDGQRWLLQTFNVYHAIANTDQEFQFPF